MNPLDLLGKIIAISHSNLEIVARINAILNIVSREMAFEEAVLYTLDKDKRLTCRFSNEKSLLFAMLNRYRCHIGEGIIGGVAQKRTPQYFTLKDVPPRFGCLFYPELDGQVEKYKTFSFLPLSDDSFLYGVLLLVSSSREVIHDSEKILLSMVSREVGGILRSYDLILSSKKRISELATLSELGKALTSNTEPDELINIIALIIAKALNAIFVTIRLEHSFLKLESERYTYGRIDESMDNYIHALEETAVKSGRTISFKEYAPEQCENLPNLSVYASPILSKNRVLGTITICGNRLQEDFAGEENGQYLITTIANYLSSGLENTLLNTKLRDVVKELGAAQKRLLEQETFRSLGEMTANIAHEIKNPLVIIGGFTKRLAKKARLDLTENKYVEIIMKEVARLEAILNEILSYAKENPMLVKECNVHNCLDEIIYLFTSDTAWEKLEIVKEYSENLPPVRCDDQLMKQVFINILMNAFEAMNGVGSITIRTDNTSFQGRPFIAISISDRGGGIEPAIVDNVFNPFFTTKERGTGLGLAISNKIVMNHGGHIDVKNLVGKGATFIVHLPVEDNIMKEGFV